MPIQHVSLANPEDKAKLLKVISQLHNKSQDWDSFFNSIDLRDFSPDTEFLDTQTRQFIRNKKTHKMLNEKHAHAFVTSFHVEATSANINLYKSDQAKWVFAYTYKVPKYYQLGYNLKITRIKFTPKV